MSDYPDMTGIEREIRALADWSEELPMAVVRQETINILDRIERERDERECRISKRVLDEAFGKNE